MRGEAAGTGSPGISKAATDTEKLVPTEGKVVTSMKPPWLRTMPRAVDRPSPVPRLRDLVVKNGS